MRRSSPGIAEGRRPWRLVADEQPAQPRPTPWEGIPSETPTPPAEDVEDPVPGVVDLGLLFIGSISGLANN